MWRCVTGWQVPDVLGENKVKQQANKTHFLSPLNTDARYTTFDMLGTTNLTTQLKIPEALKFQQQHCEKLRSTCYYFCL